MIRNLQELGKKRRKRIFVLDYCNKDVFPLKNLKFAFNYQNKVIIYHAFNDRQKGFGI